MATTTRLNMKFLDAGGDKMNINLNHADEDVQDATVKTLMDGIITNKVIFENVPTSKVSADLITTTTTPLDIED